MASTSHAAKMTRHFAHGLVVTGGIQFQQQPSHQREDEKAGRRDEGSVKKDQRHLAQPASRTEPISIRCGACGEHRGAAKAINPTVMAITASQPNKSTTKTPH